MTNRATRIVFTISGVLLLLVGSVFGGQGLGLIPGSFMTGDRTWFYIGLVLAFIGLAMLLVALRRRNGGRA